LANLFTGRLENALLLLCAFAAWREKNVSRKGAKAQRSNTNFAAAAE
jgi:hypothetical protein